MTCTQFVLLLSVLLMTIPGWVVCKGIIGGDEAVARQRRQDTGSEDSTAQEGIMPTQCICTAVGSSSTLTCTTPITDCESDEVQYNGSCYRFTTETPKTRNESVLDCIERNSHLVYIESREEQLFLAGQASSLGDHDYWIGLLLYSVTYVWLDKSPYDPELFTIDTSDGGNCILINSGEFRTRVCDNSRHFICESQKTPSGCGDLHEFDDSCYEVEQNNIMMYDEALQYCTVRGGHLLYIETANELSEVTYQLGLDDRRGYWIGLKVIRYRWMDGSPALFQTFETYNGHDGNECFRMRHDGNFNWNDFGCDANSGFICERRISTTPTLISEEFAWCLPSIPVDLIRLSQSGSLCIATGDSSTPILHECDTGEGGDDSVGNAVDDCSCFKTTTGATRCICGFCSFNFNANEATWPPRFDCYCSSGVEKTHFNITANDGEFECSSEITKNTPSLMVTSTVGTVTLYKRPDNVTSISSNSVPIAAGISLASFVLLVALIGGLVCWKKRGNRTEESNKSLTSSSDAAYSRNDISTGRSQIPGIHHNAAFTLYDDKPPASEDVCTDQGYEDPDALMKRLPKIDSQAQIGTSARYLDSQLAPQQQPKKFERDRPTKDSSNYIYDYAAVTVPTVAVDAWSGSKQGYVNVNSDVNCGSNQAVGSTSSVQENGNAEANGKHFNQSHLVTPVSRDVTEPKYENPDEVAGRQQHEEREKGTSGNLPKEKGGNYEYDYVEVERPALTVDSMKQGYVNVK